MKQTLTVVIDMPEEEWGLLSEIGDNAYSTELPDMLAIMVREGINDFAFRHGEGPLGVDVTTYELSDLAPLAERLTGLANN
jgi:hypothetical protein